MIEALKAPTIALTLGANNGAAMPAGVEQAVEGALLIATEDDRPARGLAGAKIAGFLELGGVPNVDPALAEDARHLLAQDPFRDQHLTVEQKRLFLVVIYDVGAR